MLEGFFVCILAFGCATLFSISSCILQSLLLFLVVNRMCACLINYYGLIFDTNQSYHFECRGVCVRSADRTASRRIGFVTFSYRDVGYSYSCGFLGFGRCRGTRTQ